MMSIRGIAVGAALIAALATGTASAQNVGNNAGIWWNPAPAQPTAFTFLNPLTTVYGRIGFMRSFQQESGLALNDAVGPANIPAQAINLDDPWGAMIGLGARLMPVLRYEMQLGGTFNARARLSVVGAFDFQSHRYSSVQWMNNFYFDVAPLFANNLWGLNPYVMAGLGASWNRTSDNTVLAGAVLINGSGATRTDFAWNVGVGVQWQAMRNLIVDVAYRYLDAGHYRLNLGPGGLRGERFDNVSHQVMFSIVVPVDGLIRGFGN